MTSPPPDADPPDAAQPRGPLVLIVDDNQKNLKLARDVLRAAGFETLEAATGAEAIALAARHAPSVILMDLRLPDMDGTDATKRLRDGVRTASIPVVALSSLQFDESNDWLLAAGFDGCLAKPINVAEFPDQVRAYVSGAHA